MWQFIHYLGNLLYSYYANFVQVQFKGLTAEAFHGLRSTHKESLLPWYVSIRQQRVIGKYKEPKNIQRAYVQYQAFSAVAPTLWNSFSKTITMASSLTWNAVWMGHHELDATQWHLLLL